MKARFDWADTLAFQLRVLGLPTPVREHRFDARRPARRWRFDLAWLDPHMVAAEVNGAEWAQGRHTRGGGMAKDFEKLNAAALQGWTVFQFTGSQVKDGYAEAVLWQALQPAGVRTDRGGLEQPWKAGL